MSRVWVFCDFNHRLDDDVYGLRKLGTAADLARLGLILTPGLELTLYDYDEFEDGTEAWLAADAVVIGDVSAGAAARVDLGGFRRIRRVGHAARIYWSDTQATRGLPPITETIDPAWFEGDTASEGWSLACSFPAAPQHQGSPSLASVHFTIAHAPHDRLVAGTRLHVFERATQATAIVEIVH